VSQTSVFESLYQEELYQVPARVMVVISKAWEALTEEDRTLLTKILGSVKLSPATVQLVVRHEFSVEDLTAFAPTRVIAFGALLQSSSRTYENLSVNGTSIIIADSLDKLDDVKKKNLWLALKQMFGL
jgi:hypothetical protein